MTERFETLLKILDDSSDVIKRFEEAAMMFVSPVVVISDVLSVNDYVKLSANVRELFSCRLTLSAIEQVVDSHSHELNDETAGSLAVVVNETLTNVLSAMTRILELYPDIDEERKQLVKDLNAVCDVKTTLAAFLQEDEEPS